MGIFSSGKAKIYRLTVSEDETRRKIRSYRYSRSGLTILLSGVLVLLIGIIYCCIAFTPLRYTIPGYPDGYSKKQAVVNAIKIDSLENIIVRWELYAENLNRVLSGKKTISLDSLVKGNTTKYLREFREERFRRQDSLLRDKILRAKEYANVGGGGDDEE